MANAPDIIEFARPDTNNKNLYVKGISNRLTEPSVNERLYHIFSQFGLLYEVQVLGGPRRPLTSEGHDLSEQSNIPSTSSSSKGQGFYAFIKYYSSREAQKALQTVNGKYLLDDRLLKVMFANRQRPVENCPPLGFKQCYELANHYLGFNGWTSQIESLKEDKDRFDCEPNTVRFIGIVRIDIRLHGVYSEGIGVGEVTYIPQDPMNKIIAFHRAKKIAIQRASEGAFSKVIIVVLSNGKVAVEVNSTAVDSLHFVTQEELKGVVTVTQIDPTSKIDGPGADTEGALDADNTKDLDEINFQLLLDLQADM